METPTDASLTAAKGLAEGGVSGAPAVPLNADALSPFSVSIDEIPSTPPRIRAALRAGNSVVTDQQSK